MELFAALRNRSHEGDAHASTPITEEVREAGCSIVLVGPQLRICEHVYWYKKEATENAFRAAKAAQSIIPHALNGPWSSTPRRRDATPLPSPSMISATPRLLLDALDGQRKDRLHRGSTTINVQQLASDEARLVSAEENHGVADVGWQAEAPHGRPAALVPVLNHLEHLGRQPAEDAVVAGARTDDVHRDALLGERDREITSQRLLRC